MASNEAKIQLALNALKIDPKLSIREVAKLYKAKEIILYRRYTRVLSHAKTLPNF